MCLICVDVARQAMKPAEARRALGEMRAGMEAAHVAEVEKQIDEAERAAPPAAPGGPTP